MYLLQTQATLKTNGEPERAKNKIFFSSSSKAIFQPEFALKKETEKNQHSILLKLQRPE